MEAKQIQIKCSSDQFMTFSDMVPFEDNPRELSDSGFRKLKKSLLQLGVFKPFLIWKTGSKVLGGNQRYRVLEHLVETEGYSIDKLPVTVIDCDEATARTIVLRDNQSDGDWAYEELAEYMNKLKELGGDLDLTGFTSKEHDDLKKLAESGDELRQRLEEEAGRDDIDDMVKKKFGITFKVPEEDWDYWQDVLNYAKGHTDTDDVWKNIKFMFEQQLPLVDPDHPHPDSPHAEMDIDLDDEVAMDEEVDG